MRLQVSLLKLCGFLIFRSRVFRTHLNNVIDVIDVLKFANMQIWKSEICFLNLIISPSSMSYARVPH